MSKLPKSLGKKSWLIAVAVVALLLILVYPLKHWWSSRGLDAMQRGDAQTDVNHALVWYKVAATFLPHDPTVLDKLAAADIKTNHPADALRAAKRAAGPEDGTQALILESQALMELGETNAGCEIAQTAVQSSTDNQDAGLQLGLCYAAVGDNSKLGQTISLLGSSEAAGTLQSVQHNSFALAQELYVTGLLSSSQRILQSSQIQNSDSYLLQTRITLQLGNDSQKSLQDSRGLLEKGIAISPERIDLRQLLQSVDTKLGNTSDANEQGSKIQALQNGKV